MLFARSDVIRMYFIGMNFKYSINWIRYNETSGKKYLFENWEMNSRELRLWCSRNYRDSSLVKRGVPPSMATSMYVWQQCPSFINENSTPSMTWKSEKSLLILCLVGVWTGSNHQVFKKVHSEVFEKNDYDKNAFEPGNRHKGSPKRNILPNHHAKTELIILHLQRLCIKFHLVNRYKYTFVTCVKLLGYNLLNHQYLCLNLPLLFIFNFLTLNLTLLKR